MQEEIPIQLRKSRAKAIVIDDTSDRPPSINEILVEIDDNPLSKFVPKGEGEPCQHSIYQLPYSRTQIFISLHHDRFAYLLDQLVRMKNQPIQQALAIHKVEFQSRDQQTWKLTVNLLSMTDTTVTFHFEYDPSEELDETKSYKMQFTLYGTSTKKQKDTKKSFDSKANSSGCVIVMPLNQLEGEQVVTLEAYYKIWLQFEITVEPHFKYSSRDEVGYTGLLNQSSLCYMNSVFQILFKLTEFRRLIFQIQDIADKYEFPATLQHLFYNLMNNKSAVSTQEIIRSFKWDYEQQTIQHDVHEFTMELLKGIENRLENQKPLAQSIINLFQGQQENHIQGIHQPFDKINMEEFIGIQLPIEDCRNITESFERYCDKEILDGDNCIQTDEFGKQAAYKYHIFTSLPPVLFLNLKRYRYDMSKMAFEKINDRFEYQDTIDMLPFLSSKGVHQDKQLYKLFGVLVHRSELIHHGHYYCFLKDDDQWLKFDDKVVTRANSIQVFDDNFGGTYDSAQYDQDLGQIIESKQNCQETAYMLVYINLDKWDELLKPTGDEDIPEWIQEKEQEKTKTQELKNFIQIQCVIFPQLSKFPYLPDQNRNGLMYHKPAINSEIKSEVLAEQVKQNSIEIIFPKNFTHDQTYSYLSKLFQIEVLQLKIFLYRISTQRDNFEQVQYISSNPKLKLQSILNLRSNYKCLFLVCNDHKDQNQLEVNYKQFLEQSSKIEYINALMPKHQIITIDEDKEQTLVIIKTYEQPNSIEFFSSFTVDQSTTIKKVSNLGYDMIKHLQGDGLKLYFYYEPFQIVEDMEPEKTIKDLLIETRSSFITLLFEFEVKQGIKALTTTNGTNKHLQKNAIQWVNEMQDLREVNFKEVPNCQREFTKIMHKNESYQSLLEVVSIFSGYAIDHIILKNKEKKGSFMNVKQPGDEPQIYSASKLKPKSKVQSKGYLDELITYGNQLVFKYSTVAINDLKTQFAINYIVCPLNGEQIEYKDIICTKETLIDDLLRLAYESKHLEPLMQENGDDYSQVICLMMKKKANQEILFGNGCQYSLARLKLSQNILFMNKLFIDRQPNEESPKVSLIVKLLSSESQILRNPMFVVTNAKITSDALFAFIIQLLGKNAIPYEGEKFVLEEEQVQIISAEGKVKIMPQETTVFVCSDTEEKCLKPEERSLPLHSLFAEEDLTSLDWSFMFTHVCDMRSQRLRQQGVRLNL